MASSTSISPSFRLETETGKVFNTPKSIRLPRFNAVRGGKTRVWRFCLSIRAAKLRRVIQELVQLCMFLLYLNDISAYNNQCRLTLIEPLGRSPADLHSSLSHTFMRCHRELWLHSGKLLMPLSVFLSHCATGQSPSSPHQDPGTSPRPPAIFGLF